MKLALFFIGLLVSTHLFSMEPYIGEGKKVIYQKGSKECFSLDLKTNKKEKIDIKNCQQHIYAQNLLKDLPISSCKDFSLKKRVTNPKNKVTGQYNNNYFAGLTEDCLCVNLSEVPSTASFSKIDLEKLRVVKFENYDTCKLLYPKKYF